MVRSQPAPSALHQPESLWIAGDTPVARSLVRLADSVDFRPLLFATPADLISQTVFNPAPPTPISAVVLFTSIEDQVAALSHWINFPLVFLGATGPRERKAEIILRLQKLNPTSAREQLDRIHCPAGLPIGAFGVDETAVSLVAQLIQNRSDRRISHEAALRIRSPSLIKARA